MVLKLSLGLKRGQVVLEEHQIEWDKYAQELILVLKGILKDDAISIEHVGSTSIPTIKAKPIVDIAVAVKNIDAISKFNNVLLSSGFIYRGGDVPNQLLYVVEDENNHDIVKAHIHVVEKNSKAWKNYLFFRDYLKSHDDIANNYEALKVSLANKYQNSRKLYTKEKQAFIDKILVL